MDSSFGKSGSGAVYNDSKLASRVESRCGAELLEVVEIDAK